jgi:hypothetical protein
MPQSNDQIQLGQNLLYPLDDPNTAFSNALQNMGINPYKSNPFVNALQKNAQGARIAYLSDMSKVGGNVLSQPGYATPAEGFGNYLRGQIQGGNLIGTLTRQAQEFPSMLNTVRKYESQMASGTGASELNPYTASLRDIFAADNGKGALGAYASLRSPRLGALAGSYTRALDQRGDAAVRNFALNGNYDDDVWKYIFQSGLF